jgi:glyoxylase-like metal-dependent hydrolase (beta-lactamase superfamily II)
MPAPEVHPFHHGPSGTWSYLVVDPGSRRAAIIDPVMDYEPAAARTGHAAVRAMAERAGSLGAQLEWILETHAHADHLSGAQWLKQHWPAAQLAIGRGIGAVQRHFAPVFGFGPDFPLDGSQFDRLLDDGDRLALGESAIEVIACSGHTHDGVAYRIEDALFVGDSLFMPDAGTARCDFPGGDAAQLYRSIRRLFELPRQTRVFVCHDYGPGGRALRCETTIDEQRRSNIHVHDGIDEAAYVSLRETRDATLSVPALMLPALQVNLAAGRLPEPETDGQRYLRLPLDRF